LEKNKNKGAVRKNPTVIAQTKEQREGVRGRGKQTGGVKNESRERKRGEGAQC
jgi:hypothetical protein